MENAKKHPPKVGKTLEKLHISFLQTKKHGLIHQLADERTIPRHKNPHEGGN
ncbi:hypothetical protein YC2023_116478 [Brassica napus]